MYGFVIPYDEKKFGHPQSLHSLLELLESGTVQRMFCPQPAFKITETTDCPKWNSPGWTKIQPDTPYVYAFQTFNVAGESHLVGNFDRGTGEVFPVFTTKA